MNGKYTFVKKHINESAAKAVLYKEDTNCDGSCVKVNTCPQINDKCANKTVKLKAIAVPIILVLVAIGVFMFFRNSEKVDIVKNGVTSVVPSKETLIKNLSDEDYTVNEYGDIYGLEVGGEHVYASKGDSCIDICYGLDTKSAVKVFKVFEEKYLSSDYYIIARNDYFVYYISDKATFKKSGFKSTDNIGDQYIRE